MKKSVAAVLLCLTWMAKAEDGLIKSVSPSSVAQTADRLVAVLESKGFTVFNRIGHQANAQNVQLDLHASEVIIFGKPQVGTKLMQCAPSVAIDLPQKFLVHQIADGPVNVVYNDPRYLQQRHQIQGCDVVLEKVSGALASLVKAALSNN